jgi:CheY-like chemotaxis protein
MLRLINEILDLSKIDAGRMDLLLSDFHFPKMMEEMEDLFLPECEEKNLGFRIQCESDELIVHGDEGKVRQVLINLIGNAVKFTEQGSVRVIAKRAGEGNMVFEVADTGPGIPEELRERIFEPFHQGLEGAASGGTGLGLTIARRQVEVMGGDLFLECPREGGTRFRFTIPLPVSNRGKVDRTREVERLAPGSEVHALVVDDIRENREILSLLLEKIGCNVRTASTGPEAIEATLTSPPDVVFMDIRLPGMSGLDAIREIRNRTGEAAPRIIAVSASAFEHEKNLYMKAGCDDFIAKPFRADQIFSSLVDLLDVHLLYRTSPLPNEENRLVDLSAIPLPENLIDRMVLAAELHSTTVLKRCLKEMDALGADEARLATHLRDFLSSYDIVAIQQIIAQIPILEPLSQDKNIS